MTYESCCPLAGHAIPAPFVSGLDCDPQSQQGNRPEKSLRDCGPTVWLAVGQSGRLHDKPHRHRKGTHYRHAGLVAASSQVDQNPDSTIFPIPWPDFREAIARIRFMASMRP